EPEDRRGEVVYPSGLSTSLPADVQDALVRTIPGLRRARIVRYGYAVEYDAVQPRVLAPTLEVDGIRGLYLAGQILGTSGYEEAAALGLLAGANAALAARGAEPIVLGRDRAYAGVMIDDLTTRGVDEPYRMLTSRAEYRLLLREDNADERLLDEGVRTGLVGEERAAQVRALRDAVKEASARLAATVLTPSAATCRALEDAGLPAVGKPTALVDFLRRAEVRAADLAPLAPWLGELPGRVLARLEVDVKYEKYVERQEAETLALRGAELFPLPRELDFGRIPGLRAEIVEKLEAARPATLGQAGRIPGVTPAAVQILHVFCRKGPR
ncbi:MAG: FAD-dependent oxidoreductase, partial [Deltaproteobacteria bacterium]|nr:FAD-dependent oxidoreductase [Deltaproteobacteria bacterium]